MENDWQEPPSTESLATLPYSTIPSDEDLKTTYKIPCRNLDGQEPWAYITPIFAGILADGHWGPYKTLAVSCFIYLCGVLLLLVTSIPRAIEAGAGLGGLIGSFVLLGLGIGGVKSSVAPFTADQVNGHGKQLAIMNTGERVIIDHDLTCRKPEANFRVKLLSALACAIKGGFNLDTAEPAVQLEKYGRAVPWDEQFVEDLRQALQACKVWAIYPIVWLCYQQNQTNLISQAGQMITYGIPNDATASLNPIFVLLIVPLFEWFVYPSMHKIKLTPRPTVRMTLGFILISISMALATGIQQIVYNAPPCYNHPLECTASGNGTGSEYAYNKAAPHMKSTLQAVTMLTVAMGSALGLAMSPVVIIPT
ncbi:hypothetical protein DID88_003107 [Monilinia fructigena]|uniref:Oligopeptide transporter n=1 Tax=Monilinia fructigena TaxID=38457 RepID=A0A395IZZ0_9HELO|nr:hypothetical protein DID88_003107 [Monilinia fructigena]